MLHPPLENYGRLHCRLLLSSLVTNLFCESSKTNDKVNQVPEKSDFVGVEEVRFAINDYKPQQWEKLNSDLDDLRSLLIRKDSVAIRIPNLNGMHFPHSKLNPVSEKDSTINEDLASTELFHATFESMKLNCTFHQALSYIRPSIQMSKVIDHEDLVTYR